MNRTITKITNEMFNSPLDYFYKKSGNYEVMRDSNCEFIIKHYYYGNCICRVDLTENYFDLFNCGYSPSTLTTAQLNFLERFYKSKGYKLNYKGY